MRPVSSCQRFQWSVARTGLDPSAIRPGCAAQSAQLVSVRPPSIWVAAVAVPISRSPIAKRTRDSLRGSGLTVVTVMSPLWS